MRLNIQAKPVTQFTHEGAKAGAQTPEQALMRASLAFMLWENQFYESGIEIGARIKGLVAKCHPDFVSELAVAARSKFNLRHVGLLLTRELARNKTLKASVLTDVIQRPDELAEFLAIYWKDGKTPIAAQVKKGLANALLKFNEYQLAKWDKNSAAISLRDVMFLTHAKPQTTEQEILLKKLADKALVTPDTWETELSAGADKRETFERLMRERKLGALAFLRNLRNMIGAGVSQTFIEDYAQTVKTDRVLPFRYIAAARIVPQFEPMLEKMMLRSLEEVLKLKGKTRLLVDVSASMFGAKVSEKSDLDRFDAAAALAVLCKEVCEEVEIYTFSDSLVQVAPRSGFALVDALKVSQRHNRTALGVALRNLPQADVNTRTIVFTDEQSRDSIPNIPGMKYMVNVASYNHGIASGDWVSITGFSEAIVDFIQAVEKY